MKGQAYSLIVILIIIPLLLFITGFMSTSENIITTRTDKVLSDQMAQLARNIEDDFVRAVKTSGRRALLSEVNTVILKGEPLSNASKGMGELMSNGSLDGNLSIIMFNNTLGDWARKINSLNVGFETNVSFGNITVKNFDGFNLLVTVNVNMDISHKFSVSRINKSIQQNITVSVEGLEDPLYILNSGGAVQKQILRYPYKSHALRLYSDSFRSTRATGNCTGEVTFALGGDPNKILVVDDADGLGGYKGIVSETANLPSVSCYSVSNTNAVARINDAINAENYSMLYLNENSGVWLLPMTSGLQFYSSFNVSGPDFLMRLEGKLDTTNNSLESFVMDAPGLPNKPAQTRLDYLYFDTPVIAGSEVDGFPSWLLVDVPSSNIYNITPLLQD